MKLIVLGLLIVLIGVFSFFFYPVVKAEINLFLLDNNYFRMQILAVQKKERKLTPVNRDFGIVINKILANAKIVDFSDYNNNSSLQYVLSTDLVHQPDSAYPGQIGNMVLISQAAGDWYKYTRSNPEFYLMYKLHPQDVIEVFYKGEEFDYLVTDIFKVSESRLKDFTRQSGQKQLTILSGWPSGTMINRLVIQAKMVE